MIINLAREGAKAGEQQSCGSGSVQIRIINSDFQVTGTYIQKNVIKTLKKVNVFIFIFVKLIQVIKNLEEKTIKFQLVICWVQAGSGLKKKDRTRIRKTVRIGENIHAEARAGCLTRPAASFLGCWGHQQRDCEQPSKLLVIKN